MANPTGINQYTKGGSSTPQHQEHGARTAEVARQAAHGNRAAVVARIQDMGKAASAASDKATSSRYPEDHRDAANAHRYVATAARANAMHGAGQYHERRAIEHDAKYADALSRTAKTPEDHAAAAAAHSQAAKSQYGSGNPIGGGYHAQRALNERGKSRG